MIFPLAFIEGIGGPELMMILFVVLLLFGANKLPELARGFGKSMREFKKAASGVEEEVRRALEEEPAKLHSPQPVKTIEAPAPESSETATTAEDDSHPEQSPSASDTPSDGDHPSTDTPPPSTPPPETPPPNKPPAS